MTSVYVSVNLQSLYTKLEERHFYPVVRAVDESLILDAAEEHENIESMISKAEDAEADEDGHVRHPVHAATPKKTAPRHGGRHPSRHDGRDTRT